VQAQPHVPKAFNFVLKYFTFKILLIDQEIAQLLIIVIIYLILIFLVHGIVMFNIQGKICGVTQ
jgi:hypothetical protein